MTIKLTVNYKYLHSILQSDYICIKGVEIFISKCSVKKGRGITDHFIQLCLKDTTSIKAQSKLVFVVYLLQIIYDEYVCLLYIYYEASSAIVPLPFFKPNISRQHTPAFVKGSALSFS